MVRLSQPMIRATVRIRNHSGENWGTGFGYVRPDEYNTANPALHTSDDPRPWRFWYVTCAHVVDAIEANAVGDDRRIHLELNESVAGGGGVTTVHYPIDHFWTRHRVWTDRCQRLGPIASRQYTIEDAAVDVAVTTAPTQYKHWGALEWSAFPPWTHLTRTLLLAGGTSEKKLSEGDDLFLLGFPIGFYHDTRNWPTVRRGMVAQIQPYLQGKAQTFLVDGSVFGGNSGGPVVSDANGQLRTHHLVGMTCGTRLNPATLENADLGIVVPLDTINETIEMALKDSPHLNSMGKED